LWKPRLNLKRGFRFLSRLFIFGGIFY